MLNKVVEKQEISLRTLEKAIAFATKCHHGQIRKMADTPYILHPVEVAAIIATMTNDYATMAAGLLHDTIEDCNVDPREIRRRFGPRVAALVQSETEDRFSDRPAAETWMERKEDSLLFLANTKDISVKIMWLADKLSNIRSFARGYREHGDGLWQFFHQQDPKKQGWYYYRIAELLPELHDSDAYKEYIALVDEIFAKYMD